MSSQEESFALEQRRMSTLFVRPKWDLRDMPAGQIERFAELLEAGWEPFAATDYLVYFRRLSYAAPAPLPPQ